MYERPHKGSYVVVGAYFYFYYYYYYYYCIIIIIIIIIIIQTLFINTGDYAPRLTKRNAQFFGRVWILEACCQACLGVSLPICFLDVAIQPRKVGELFIVLTRAL